MTREAELIESAYLALLRLPHGSGERLLLQGALARLRDLVATANDMLPEDVQNEFEARARNL